MKIRQALLCKGYNKKDLAKILDTNVTDISYMLRRELSDNEQKGIVEKIMEAQI